MTSAKLVGILFRPPCVNTLRLRQDGRHFADAIFKCIFLNENVWIPIKISLKFVPKGPINNIPGLVQIMAWRRPGDKPLSEPMVVSLPMHICVARPQWVNALCNLQPCHSFSSQIVLHLDCFTISLHSPNSRYCISKLNVFTSLLYNNATSNLKIKKNIYSCNWPVTFKLYRSCQMFRGPALEIQSSLQWNKKDRCLSESPCFTCHSPG